MKAGTDQLLKFKLLARDLDLPAYACEGLLSALWRVTETNTPDGAIGRLSNEEIALAIDWRGDPEKLIDALVRRVWLDSHAAYRLVVHDWAEHCEHRVHRKLARRGEFFANGSMPDLSRCDASERARALQKYASHETESAGAPAEAGRIAVGCVPLPLPLPLPLPSENLSGRPSSRLAQRAREDGGEATDEGDHAKTNPSTQAETPSGPQNGSANERARSSTPRKSPTGPPLRQTSNLRPFNDLRAEATQFAKTMRIDWRKERDRSLVVKLFFLREIGELSEAELADALDGVRRTEPKKPVAYLTTLMRNTLAARGVVLSVLLAKCDALLPGDWMAAIKPTEQAG